jgi:phosphatidylglycerol---prolipoprotein diacylglyceryl transferase
VNPSGGAVLGRLAGRRYLLRWRGLNVPGYTAMLYVGCVTGVLAGAAAAGAAGLDESSVALVTIALLIPALAGARLWFVVEHWGVFRREPRRIWRRSEGGSALHGGLALSVAVSVPFLAVLGLPFWRFWDAASLTMLIGLACTRVGCLMNGCCGGRRSSGRLAVRLPDEQGDWQKRIPTQLLEAGWAVLVLTGAVLARPGAPFAGAVFLGVLAAYGAGRLVLEPTRAAAGSRASRANLAFVAALTIAATLVLLLRA